ncbi:GTP-binding protein EngB required for normal cell division [Catenuloplanes nepalensis]|uniref:GTP-binding protein EngB required for normal cell division n=1 Tax=Catenuloplanes nepalensis TaxID=587533 RepID=A0ABT9N3X3_9ACTN|nr:GTPase [Catenuloplanes nepalensis]MDP9798402.1 GTP-binding protein EngB required for normal cell division [Catenuloplanes nepalensis]
MSGGLVSRMRDALAPSRTLDADSLLRRVESLRRFLRAVDGLLPQERLAGAHTVVERADARLALSREHTVVALAGSTGSGKSSLFNALAGFALSQVGMRRPTTGAAHACVWGTLAGANALLDWVGVLPRHRFVRESPLDGDDQSALRGLVLLDLPDFDSVQRAHATEVDRLLGLVDLIVWVVDPQKYADRTVHEAYLQKLKTHAGVTVVVLNQADRLAPDDQRAVVDDLRRLLVEDGLPEVPVVATSALQHVPGLTPLRGQLEQTVAKREAALLRLSADVDATAERLGELVGPAVAEDVVDRAAVAALVDAFAVMAGVPAVAEATERAYRHRATGMTGWPLLRGLRRLRPDPLRRLHLDLPSAGPTDGLLDGLRKEDAPTQILPATSVPDPDAAQRAAVKLAVRQVADHAAAALPEPWRPGVVDAARSRLDDVPDALDSAVAGADLGIGTPIWWRLAGFAQWLVTLAAGIGLGWLITGYAVRALGLPALDYPDVGTTPLPTVLFLGGLLTGALLALIARPVIAYAARRARRRVDRMLRAEVTTVARRHVVSPVREVLQSYARAREAMALARSDHA